MKIEITFPDGAKKKYDRGITGLEIAKSISNSLAKVALAVLVDGEAKDLTWEIFKNSNIKIITFDDPEGVEIFRHSTAHLLAHAVKKLYPKALSTMGPAVDEGFYYDFDNLDIGIEDLPKIEKEMRKIVEANLIIKRIDFKNKAEAKKKFNENKYKLEMIKDFEGEASAYEQGDFIDLCRGSHVPSTGYLKAFKLTKLAGAYWKGDQKNKMLTRIYGVSFPNDKLLKEHLNMIDEAEKRDHRKIGKQMDLFSFHEEAPGMPFFHEKGMIIWDALVDYWKEVHDKLGYKMIKTPIILNKSLWLQSGHWDHYKENMYYTKIDKVDYAIKPMNCPGGLLVYKTKLHSYKEFPLRMGEIGLVHRHELSGVLSGLFRVRSFHQDDAHIYCTEEQIMKEVVDMIDLFIEIYSHFGLVFDVELSTKPKKAMGSDEMWDKAEEALESALNKKKMDYRLNKGDGAFYGPKIDFHIKDAIGRTWQCGTIQLDFSMPEKFNLHYEGADSKRHRPAMLHKATYGAVERFLGILVEHYAGKFPMWLSPEQCRFIPVSASNVAYCKKVAAKMSGLRVTVDDGSNTLNKKVREAQLSKVNYILVVGDKEEKENTVNVRTRDNKVLGAKSVTSFVKDLLKEVKDRK